MRFPYAKILVFCKAPIVGEVKTRLAKDIGEPAAVEIHKYLARHCLQQLINFEIAPVELWCTPDTNDHFFLRCQSNFGVPLKKQIGDDLGQRMQHALRETLRQHTPVVVVGTDCPGLTENYYQSALFAASNNKTVLGPAEDGGYVLLAMNQLQDEIFTNIPWGTSQVYAKTIVRLTGEVEELTPMWDIDYVENLKRLCVVSNELGLDDQFQTYLKTLHLE